MSHIERMETEFSELRQRVSKLLNFIMGSAVKELPAEDQADLKEQFEHMARYEAVLQRRLTRAKMQAAT